MKIFIGISILSILLMATGCGQEQEIQNTQEAQNKPVEEANFSIEEISTHNNVASCWLLIDGKIYDVTNFIPGHPGGSSILEGCGKEATELFNTRPMGSGTPHSEKAQTGLEQYYIGNLK